MSDTNGAIGACLDAFFCQLKACGVREAVVSPGSRSTALAMKALEHLDEVWVDIDERGAAFFALGMAKVSGRPVPLICTSGTAVANWYPAVLEAEASHIPLCVLSADRPAHLQGVGAPQTTNQKEMFGGHVRLFKPMPEMTSASVGEGKEYQSVFAAIAREAIEVARGGNDGIPGVVHLNFPFNEPLKPPPHGGDILECVRPCEYESGDRAVELAPILDALDGLPVVIAAGQGSGADPRDVDALLEVARFFNAPILADPLSQMRAYDDLHVITNYDSICTHDDEPEAAALLRFGPWGVSKRMVTSLSRHSPVHIAIDPYEPLDYTHTVTAALRACPRDIAHALKKYAPTQRPSVLEQWAHANKHAHRRLATVTYAGDEFEGAYVARLLEVIPDNSTLWVANSMAIRTLDTFMEYSPVRVYANRGLNGIDGTTSSALGSHVVTSATQGVPTTFLTGDLTLVHDLNAFALADELRRHANTAPFVVVCLNNNGGAIFDMLPQRSDEPYFERLFLTPHTTDFAGLSQLFGITYVPVNTVDSFTRAYTDALKSHGITLIDISLPLAGVPERYERFW